MSRSNDKARAYVEKHFDEFARGNGFVHKVCKKFQVKEPTVYNWLRSLGFKAKSNKARIFKALSENPDKYTAKMLSDELKIRLGTVEYHIRKNKWYGYLATRNKWARIDPELIRGKTYREIMEMFNIRTVSAMSRIAQRAHWDELVRKQNGRCVRYYVDDDVRNLVDLVNNADAVVAELIKIKAKNDQKIQFLTNGTLNQKNFDLCKTSIILGIAIKFLQNGANQP